MTEENPAAETPYDQLRARYEAGSTPWDLPDPPPEVLEIAATLPAGRALDLGCGFGRAAFYLARAGWQVDGIDFVEIPIEEARRRAAGSGLTVTFHVADVTDLPFLDGPYDLALDVGCGHSLSETQWETYRATLQRLVRPGGIFLLYGRLREEEWGLDESSFLPVMFRGFTLDRREAGMTHMPDGHSFPSAWYWFVRNGRGGSGAASTF